ERGLIGNQCTHRREMFGSFFHESLEAFAKEINARICQSAQIGEFQRGADPPGVSAHKPSLRTGRVIVLAHELAARSAHMVLGLFVEHAIEIDGGMGREIPPDSSAGIGKSTGMTIVCGIEQYPRRLNRKRCEDDK